MNAHSSESATSDHPLLGRRERRLVEMRAYVVRSDDEIVDVRVLDLSYDGCAIETKTALKMGEELKLSVLSRGAVKAKVRWCQGRRAGLKFEVEHDREQLVRQSDRIRVDAELSLRRAAKTTYRVKIFDVSRFGCRCEFVDRPEIGERVWVKFEGLEAIESVVRWVEESCLGVSFGRPLHPAVFEMLFDRCM